MKKQNPILITILIVCWFVGCNSLKDEKQAIFANENEMNVINIMNCWNSVTGESLRNSSVFENDEKKRSKLFDKSFKYDDKAEFFGRKALFEDSVFLSCVRSDSTYKSLLKDRSSIAKSLMKFRKSIPIFSEEIEKIRDQIIEYKYFDGNELGIYTDSYNKESYIFNQKFYISLSDLFKEAYIQDSTSNITDKEIVKIDSLLKRIDAIDKHVWAVPYYFESKQKFDEDNAKLEIEKAKQRKVDSLTKK